MMKRAVSGALAALALTLIPTGETSASSVEDTWKSYLTGASITNYKDFMAGGMNNTLISHYYLCADGRYVHQSEIAGGGLPPLATFGAGQLKPSGDWSLQFVHAGNTTFANLVLASAADPSIPGDTAAFRTYRLGYSQATGLTVDGIQFTAKANDSTGCGGTPSPFTVYSPLQ